MVYVRYVVNAAREARTDDPTHNQRVIYCSVCLLSQFVVGGKLMHSFFLQSVGANANSPFLYTRSKGQTEQDLSSLGYKDTIIFRPGFLGNPERSERRLVESAFGYLFSFLLLTRYLRLKLQSGSSTQQ